MINNIDDIITSEKFPKIIYFFGEEEFLIEEALEKLIHYLCPSKDSKYDFDSFNALDVSTVNLKEEFSKNVVDSCSSYPFVNSKRVVVVRNFDELFAIGRTKKKDVKPSALKNYFDNPQDTTTLLLTGIGAKYKGLSAQMKSAKDRQKALTQIEKADFPFDIIFAKYEWMEFPKVYENGLLTWLIARFKANKKEINHEAAELLLAHCNPDLREINNEIVKVLLYVQERETITNQDVNFIVASSRVNNVFELQKQIGKKNLAKAVAITENILANDDKKMLIITIITTYFTKLWKLYEIASKESNQYKLAGIIGVSPFFVNEYLSALKNYSSAQLNKAFLAIAEAEEKMKSTSTNALYLFEKMYIDIMEN